MSNAKELLRASTRSAGIPRSYSDSNLLSQCDGFTAIEEGISIVVKDENIAPYTLPQEALTFEPPPDAITCKFPNGDTERKIHCNVRLTDVEVEQLEGLRTQARSQNCRFFPCIIAMATRYISCARGNCRRALEMMQKTQEWRQTFFRKPLSDTDILESMKHGVVYFTGRDVALRPSLVVRARRIPAEWYHTNIDAFMKVLIFTMEYFMRYMVIPGKIENLNIIVDLKGLGMTNVPLAPLKEVYSVMSKHYVGRVYKFFIANMPFVLKPIVGAVKRMLTDRQQQKLVFLDNLEPLKASFAGSQLEEDFGGCRPEIKTFFPFPLNPGPFDPGYRGQPHKNSIKGVHGVLSAQAVLGKLWDPRRTVEENTSVDFSCEALTIFQACGAPIPSSFVTDDIRDPVSKQASTASSKGRMTKTISHRRRSTVTDKWGPKLCEVSENGTGDDTMARKATLVDTLNLILPVYGDEDPLRKRSKKVDQEVPNRRRTAAGDGADRDCTVAVKNLKEGEVEGYPAQVSVEAVVIDGEIEDRHVNPTWGCGVPLVAPCFTSFFGFGGRCNYPH